MALQTPTGFIVGINEPIDSRIVTADRTSIDIYSLYVGLVVYQTGSLNGGAGLYSYSPASFDENNPTNVAADWESVGIQDNNVIDASISGNTLTLTREGAADVSFTPQTSTGGITAVTSDATLTGDGTSATPLGVVYGTTADTALEGNTALLQLGTTSTTALAGNTPTIQDLDDTAVAGQYVSEVDVSSGAVSITRAALPTVGDPNRTRVQWAGQVDNGAGITVSLNTAGDTWTIPLASNTIAREFFDLISNEDTAASTYALPSGTVLDVVLRDTSNAVIQVAGVDVNIGLNVSSITISGSTITLSLSSSFQVTDFLNVQYFDIVRTDQFDDAVIREGSGIRLDTDVSQERLVIEADIQHNASLRGNGTAGNELAVVFGTASNTALAGDTPTIQDLDDTAVSDQYISEVDVSSGVVSITRAALPTQANQFADQSALESFITDDPAFRTAIGAGTSDLVLGTTSTTALAGNTATIQDLDDTAVSGEYISEVDVSGGVVTIMRAALPTGGGVTPHNTTANARLTGIQDEEFVSTNTVWTIAVAVEAGFTYQIIQVDNVTNVPNVTISPIPTSAAPAQMVTITSGSATPVSIPISVRVITTHTTDMTTEHTNLTATLHSYNAWFSESFSVSQMGVSSVGYTDNRRFDGDETFRFTPAVDGTDEFLNILLPDRTNGYRFRVGGFDSTADEMESGAIGGVQYTRYEFTLRRAVTIEINNI